MLVSKKRLFFFSPQFPWPWSAAPCEPPAALGGRFPDFGGSHGYGQWYVHYEKYVYIYIMWDNDIEVLFRYFERFIVSRHLFLCVCEELFYTLFIVFMRSCLDIAGLRIHVHIHSLWEEEDFLMAWRTVRMKVVHGFHCVSIVFYCFLCFCRVFCRVHTVYMSIISSEFHKSIYSVFSLQVHAAL